MEAAVFLFDWLKAQKISPDDTTHAQMELLHGKKLKERTVLCMPVTAGRKLAPRRRIHKIVKGRHVQQHYATAIATHKATVIAWLITQQPMILATTRDAPKRIHKACKIPLADAKYVWTHLKRTKGIPAPVPN
jgi:hypothetical protein